MHEKMKPVPPTVEAETRWWSAGYTRVAGLDEAGRGAWAGPVFAGAVILPPYCLPALLEGVRDSKQLSPARREMLLAAIVTRAVAVGAGSATAAEIDALGIVPATRLAMARALAALTPQPEALLIDALPLPEIPLPQRSFPFADALSLSVAAASIVAKVSRDRWMVEVAERDFPGYGFARHKGYGTRQHQEALSALGVSAIHRHTFRPVAEIESARESPDQSV